MKPQHSMEERYDSKNTDSSGITINVYWLYFYWIYGEIQKGDGDIAIHLISHKIEIWTDLYTNI